MSYQIGQKVFAVHFKYRSATLHRYFYTQPFLFCDEVPETIQFLKLTVVSKHAVRINGEVPTKEAAHHGFLLRDESGHTFACQYPNAAADVKFAEGCRRFSFYDTGGQLEEWLLKNPYDFYSLEGALEKLYQLIQVTDVENISPTDSRRQRHEDRRSAMMRFYNRVIQEFHEKFPDEPTDRFHLIQAAEHVHG